MRKSTNSPKTVSSKASPWSGLMPTVSSFITEPAQRLRKLIKTFLTSPITSLNKLMIKPMAKHYLREKPYS